MIMMGLHVLGKLVDLKNRTMNIPPVFLAPSLRPGESPGPLAARLALWVACRTKVSCGRSSRDWTVVFCVCLDRMDEGDVECLVAAIMERYEKLRDEHDETTVCGIRSRVMMCRACLCLCVCEDVEISSSIVTHANP